jgi:hypothetical protein
MPCRVVVDDNRVKMHYPGNILVGVSAIEPALRFVASAERFAVATCRAWPWQRSWLSPNAS